jgi:hypothetical protein
MNTLHSYVGPVESPQPESGVFPAAKALGHSSHDEKLLLTPADMESARGDETVRAALMTALVVLANAAARLSAGEG